MEREHTIDYRESRSSPAIDIKTVNSRKQVNQLDVRYMRKQLDLGFLAIRIYAKGA